MFLICWEALDSSSPFCTFQQNLYMLKNCIVFFLKHINKSCLNLVDLKSSIDEFVGLLNISRFAVRFLSHLCSVYLLIVLVFSWTTVQLAFDLKRNILHRSSTILSFSLRTTPQFTEALQTDVSLYLCIPSRNCCLGQLVLTLRLVANDHFSIIYIIFTI